MLFKSTILTVHKRSQLKLQFLQSLLELSNSSITINKIELYINDFTFPYHVYNTNNMISKSYRWKPPSYSLMQDICDYCNDTYDDINQFYD